MILAREDVYGAFWTKVSAAKSRLTGQSPFVTMSRRLRHWNNVAKEEQPAMFMVEHQQIVHQQKGVPPKWVFNLSLFLYDFCADGDIPGPRLNVLLDAVDDALAPLGGSGGRQTLGELVSHCWISGPIETYEGYEGMMNQSVAIVPIEITIPDASGPV